MCLKLKIVQGHFHMWSTDITRSDTPSGSKKSHFLVDVSKLVLIWYIRRRVLLLLTYSVH